MPALIYPITANPRRGYYKDTPSDVETVVSAAWGETLTFRFSNPEGTVTAGAFAEITIKITAANIANGTAFQLAQQDFFADNAVPSNTDTLVNFNQSDALKHANNLRAAVLSNIFFSGKVSVTVTASGADYNVQILWLRRGNQFTAGTTAPAPYTIVSSSGGTNVDLVDGYAFVYQVWMDDGGADKPITDLREIVPQIGTDEVYANIEIEVNDALRPYLNLLFQSGIKTTAGIEANARKKFWIQYGWREVNKSTGLCAVFFHDITETAKEWVTYSALQETDRFGMLLWIETGAVLRRFLTKRPNWYVSRDSVGWSYVYLDDKERYAIASLSYTRVIDHWNGAAWVNILTSTMGTADGIYRVPSHPANIGATIPASSSRYRVQVKRVVGAVTDTIAEQVWEISGTKPALQMWFLGDLPSYEDLYFDELLEEENVVDMDIAAMPISPYDNDTTANYGARLIDGGRQIVSAKNFRKYTGLIKQMCDQEQAKQYLESFLKSPFKYVRYTSLYPQYPNPGQFSLKADLQRAVFVDPGSVVIRSDGEMVDIEITFYFHKELEQQI